MVVVVEVEDEGGKGKRKKKKKDHSHYGVCFHSVLLCGGAFIVTMCFVLNIVG